MVPKLGYLNIKDDTHKAFTGGLFGRLLGRLFDKSDHQQRCLWQFVDKSLQVHKAPVLEILAIELIGPFRCHVDVGKWIANAVDRRRVHELALVTTWTAVEPAHLSKTLYTCDTIVNLYLVGNILVDVPSRVFLPSVVSNVLYYVLLHIWCNSINFSKLMECNVTLSAELDWLEPLMGLLQNSPNLKDLYIDQTLIQLEEDFSLSWNEPSSVPRCFSAHLEIFEWKGYIGRIKEKEAIKYIFANSKCLKRAGFSMKSTFKVKDREKMMKELESMSRVSTSSQLLFSTQLDFPSFMNEMY
ncbi:PREDICTED: putative F-box/FBD/LRR-repeat protein At1g22000 [Camelina sativa]|uniref:F-box/FBD/LRR-repeat protein At1g22000 n=1 Tax=Camelina sativa TaxID=90675 RepID=A0ABM0Y4Q6_CAMSA|nr:PREDICTED: putative F-box/FBD/LRR-repeat protein At1g22000 [Camelina sativa]